MDAVTYTKSLDKSGGVDHLDRVSEMGNPENAVKLKQQELKRTELTSRNGVQSERVTKTLSVGVINEDMDFFKKTAGNNPLMVSVYRKYVLKMDVDCTFLSLIDRDALGLKQALLRRIRTLPPVDITTLLNSIALALSLVDKSALFIDLSLLLQQQTKIRPQQCLLWVTLLLYTTGNLSPNQYIWICTILNEVARKLDPPVAIRMAPVETLKFSDWNFDYQLLLNACCHRCEELQDNFYWNGSAFCLGTNFTRIVGNVKSTQCGTEEVSPLTRPIALVNDLYRDIQQLKQEKEQLGCTFLDQTAPPRNSIFVIDTNVIVDHLNTLTTLGKLHHVHMAIPTIVVNELQGLVQARPDIDKSIPAFLDNLPPSFSFLSTDGVLLDVLPIERTVWPNCPQIRSNDDAIIYTVGRCANAVLVSDDVNLGLWAHANRLPALSFEAFLHIFHNCEGTIVM